MSSHVAGRPSPVLDRLQQARVHTLPVDMILMTICGILIFFGLTNVIGATLVEPEPRRVTLVDISSGKVRRGWVAFEGKLDPTRSFEVEKVVTRGQRGRPPSRRSPSVTEARVAPPHEVEAALGLRISMSLSPCWCRVSVLGR